MGLDGAREGKLLYHLTELNNLESIIDYGLVPRKVLAENTVAFDDIANPEWPSRSVPMWKRNCWTGAGGCLVVILKWSSCCGSVSIMARIGSWP